MSNPADGWTWHCWGCGADVPWQDTHACAAPLPVSGIDTGDIHRRATLAQVQPEIDALKARLAAAEERAARAEQERDDAIAIRSCECGVEEACRLVRERDKARAEAARYREALERIAEAERLITPDGHTLPDIARAALAGKGEP